MMYSAGLPRFTPFIRYPEHEPMNQPIIRYPEHEPMNQPTNEAARRKAQPLYSGVLAYFPDALLAVAELSRIGNEQHNPGKPLHWDRTKSTDEPDALARHLLQRGELDTDGVRHSAKVAWRALAMLQKEIEGERQDRELRAGLVRQELESRRIADLEFRIPNDPKACPPGKCRPVDDCTQRPDENAKQHRDRVNSPWPASKPLGWEAGERRYARQPDDFAAEPEPRGERRKNDADRRARPWTPKGNYRRSSEGRRSGDRERAIREGRS